MAQIVLSEVGAALGARLLPQGLSVLGAQVAGAAIGRAAGSVLGAAVDASLFGRSAEGPRLRSIDVMESREGAPIPNVFGRMRVGGQVIWAGDFTEHRRERGGGKGGPEITEFSYSASFAVAIAEGVVSRIDRAWANGEPLALGDVAHRFYSGHEDQTPDALVEAIEGPACAPAYRGTAYIVFEDLPLETFGNRLPQLSFEITRAPPKAGDGPALRDLVQAVNVIPASGEFVYASDVVRTRRFPGVERPINMNNARRVADFHVSLDQLGEDLPLARRAALTVAWFGDDLRAEACRIRPGVETRDRSTVPWSWRAGGVGRSDARLVSQTPEGAAYFGGTPADRAVVQGLRDMVARGVEVTVTPFLLMDVPPKNSLPDPYGAAAQAPFPCRGRITAGPDQSTGVASAIAAFLGSAAVSDFSLDGDEVRYSGDTDDWGYRRFVLHHAWLAKAAGGVSAFLVGSEMRGLTRLRDAAGGYPFVDGLIELARDVRTVLGPSVQISYAADWTEYGAIQAGGGTGDVFFPLDGFWADPDVDFVGIDWYPPLGDWRDGEGHLDAQAGFAGPDDPAYLFHQIEGGEGFDWYYASDTDRAAQIRTPIVDTAHGEHWVFRVKDLRAWWENAHHDRPGGVREAAPTAWTPGSKPIRLTEIGFPAVDRGGNAPNLFFDPKSSESAVPPYSSGERDDVFQRRALEAALAHYQAQSFIDGAYVWAWDGRPWPDFPLRETVWSDGPNWSLGHWLNGRAGLAPLSDVVQAICDGAGVEADASALDGLVDGYALTGVHSVRAALEPLATMFGFGALERDGRLVFEPVGEGGAVPLEQEALGGDGLVVRRDLMDKTPGRVRLSFTALDQDYAAGSVSVFDETGDSLLVVDVTLPVAMTGRRAETIAARLLEDAKASRRAFAELSLADLRFEPGDLVTVAGGAETWMIAEIEERAGARRLTLAPSPSARLPLNAIGVGTLSPPAPSPGDPELFVIDPPSLPGDGGDWRPLVAASADPWPGAVRVFAGPDATALRPRAVIDQPALVGALEAPLAPGPLGRWDFGAELRVRLPGGALSSVSGAAALSGANAAFVRGEAGWELLSFRDATLVEPDVYVLSGLLRGLRGTDPAMASGAPADAPFILLDGALVRAEFAEDEAGLERLWRTDGSDLETVLTLDRVGDRPWSVAHLKAERSSGGATRVSWIRRGSDVSDSWPEAEAASTGRFAVATASGGSFGPPETVVDPEVLIPPGPSAVRVAEIGADGRHGPWVSITL